MHSPAATAAAERWDMPMAYAAGNSHPENGVRFAEAVTQATGGDIEVVVHASGSLFKGGEIFRAVRTGQAPIGERLISALGNDYFRRRYPQLDSIIGTRVIREWR